MNGEHDEDLPVAPADEGPAGEDVAKDGTTSEDGTTFDDGTADEVLGDDRAVTTVPAPTEESGSRGQAVLRRGWRPVLAVAAAAALVWGVGAAQDGARLGDRGTAGGDPAGVTGAPPERALVESAAMACPGPEPLLGQDGTVPDVRVLAVGAPQSVLDAVPPQLEGAARDDAATTGGPGTDGSASTSGAREGDGTATTSAPAGKTDGGIDAAARTDDPVSDDAGPRTDAAARTDEAPEEDGAGQEEPDTEETSGASATAPPGASLLRTTDGAAREELEHGIPAEVTLEDAASAVVTAHAELAPAVLGGLLGVGTAPGARGAALAACAPQDETVWLVGGDDAPGRTEQLVLTNPGTDTVTVEVSVWGGDGPVATTGSSAVVVPAGGRSVEVLDALAPGADAPVLRVRASGGPVVAQLAEHYRDGTTDRGAELVSPAAAPSTDLVVPALPPVPEGLAGQVVLRLAAPGTAEAVVDVTALTADGAQRLADQVTRVPAGSTVDVVLDELPEGPVALRLRSDEPVVAGARLEVLPVDDEPVVLPGDAGDEAVRSEDGKSVRDGDGTDDADGTDGVGTTDDGGAEQGPRDQAEPLVRPAGETAWVAATRPSTSPTGIALPDRAAVPDGSAQLALTAVDGTTAWVTWVDAEGGETARWVDLANDTTVVLPVPEDARAAWVVGAGPAGVASALHVTGADELGPYLAAATLPQLPWMRHRTEVRPVVP